MVYYSFLFSDCPNSEKFFLSLNPDWASTRPGQAVMRLQSYRQTDKRRPGFLVWIMSK